MPSRPWQRRRQRPPPTWSDATKGWQYRFGGDWNATREPELHETIRRAFLFCSRYFDEETDARLRQALSTQGRWCLRGPVGETLHISSLPQHIAARIRF